MQMANHLSPERTEKLMAEQVFGNREVGMSCLSCGAKKQAEFSAEMLIHFGGLKNQDKPGVWVFPELLVCLDCGFARAAIPAPELAQLAAGCGDQ
jgi:hypothetical protein